MSLLHPFSGRRRTDVLEQNVCHLFCEKIFTDIWKSLPLWFKLKIMTIIHTLLEFFQMLIHQKPYLRKGLSIAVISRWLGSLGGRQVVTAFPEGCARALELWERLPGPCCDVSGGVCCCWRWRSWGSFFRNFSALWQQQNLGIHLFQLLPKHLCMGPIRPVVLLFQRACNTVCWLWTVLVFTYKAAYI